MNKVELALVMPVYNEGECIQDVVDSWLAKLQNMKITFRLIILNDGSNDNTKEKLETFTDSTNISVINKVNSGHGPTILEGYRIAVEIADWVFQCDSDDEMPADYFDKLWKLRDSYDAIFGYRVGRNQNLARKLISMGSRITIRMIYGSGFIDVNTPYRLMNGSILKQIICQIRSDTFAPNVIISGAFIRWKSRINNIPVPHKHRMTGTVSIVKWKLWSSALLALYQTLRYRPCKNKLDCRLEFLTDGEMNDKKI